MPEKIAQWMLDECSAGFARRACSAMLGEISGVGSSKQTPGVFWCLEELARACHVVSGVIKHCLR